MVVGYRNFNRKYEVRIGNKLINNLDLIMGYDIIEEDGRIMPFSSFRLKKL